MSGGYFDYKQYHINQIAGDVEKLAGCDEYPPEILAEFAKGAAILNQAAVYAQRIDWLLSGDDGEESFILRLKEDLGKLAP